MIKFYIYRYRISLVFLLAGFVFFKSVIASVGWSFFLAALTSMSFLFFIESKFKIVRRYVVSSTLMQAPNENLKIEYYYPVNWPITNKTVVSRKDFICTFCQQVFVKGTSYAYKELYTWKEHRKRIKFCLPCSKRLPEENRISNDKKLENDAKRKELFESIDNYYQTNAFATIDDLEITSIFRTIFPQWKKPLRDIYIIINVIGLLLAVSNKQSSSGRQHHRRSYSNGSQSGNSYSKSLYSYPANPADIERNATRTSLQIKNDFTSSDLPKKIKCNLSIIGGEDENTFIQFDEKLKRIASTKKSDEFISLIKLPLVYFADHRKHVLRTEKDLRNELQKIFSDNVRNSILNEKEFYCTTEGIIYGDSTLWVLAEKEKNSNEKYYIDTIILGVIDESNLPSLTNPEPRFGCETMKYKIVIDDIGTSLRYRAWSLQNDFNNTPDLALENVKISSEGSGICSYQIFTAHNGNYKYKVTEGSRCGNGIDIDFGSVQVFKGEKRIADFECKGK